MDGKVSSHFEPSADGCEMRHPAAHVVGRPAGIKAFSICSQFARGVMRWSAPGLTLDRLQIEVAVDEQSGSGGVFAAARGGDQRERPFQVADVTRETQVQQILLNLLSQLENVVLVSGVATDSGKP